MLRRLKIGGRVNLLIAVPLLALLAFAAVGYIALERSSVRGEEYQALKKAQDLVIDTAPPPASLLEVWAQVNHIGVVVAADGFAQDAIAEVNYHLNIIDAARVRFETSLAEWAARDLDRALDLRLVQVGGDIGFRFFRAVDTELRPALAAQDVAAVLAVIKSLEWRYDVQQSGITRAQIWAEHEVADREQSTDEYVGRVIMIAGIAVGSMLLLTLLLSVRVRRSIVRPIRRLAAQAKSVATRDLPGVVQSVQDLPADAPTPHLPVFEVDTRDELAELGASFNSVQDAAVDLAAEQAMARRIVSENLINIARRNQNLLGRTLGFISTLEQGERDPEALDNLFRLDHLTTRMRRNAQSLLVLAGAEPTRLWAPPVPVGDVVRAALSEVENYGQVELADLGDIGIQGAVASEVAHLLAELLENATSFSPPNSPVTVVGRAAPDGHQLAIFDYGLGMPADELAEANRRLNQVSSFDRESNKMLGFQVVARLAARHDIKVMLTTTPGGTGVTAIVRLPRTILETVGASAAPLVDVPAVAERLSAPLTPVAPPAVPAMRLVTDAKPTEMSDEALWASMRQAEAGSGPTGESAAALSPSPSPSLSPLSLPVQPIRPPDAAVVNPATPATLGTPPADAVPVAPVAAAVAGSTIPGDPLLPATPAPVTSSGLTKRVRGAQMPDLGTAMVDSSPVRPADEVRTTLASLQRGIDLGRSRGTDS